MKNKEFAMLDFYLSQVNAIDFRIDDDMSLPAVEVISAMNHSTNYINSGQLDVAAAIVRKAEGKLTRSRERLFFAECYIANGDYESALRLIATLIASGKNNCHYLNLAACVYMCLNDYKKAKFLLNKICKLNKKFKAAVLNSAVIDPDDAGLVYDPGAGPEEFPVSIFFVQ